jgi:hypothetical protein
VWHAGSVSVRVVAPLHSSVVVTSLHASFAMALELAMVTIRTSSAVRFNRLGV